MLESEHEDAVVLVGAGNALRPKCKGNDQDSPEPAYAVQLPPWWPAYKKTGRVRIDSAGFAIGSTQRVSAVSPRLRGGTLSPRDRLRGGESPVSPQPGQNRSYASGGVLEGRASDAVAAASAEQGGAAWIEAVSPETLSLDSEARVQPGNVCCVEIIVRFLAANGFRG
jgi:hypothetical protein